MFTKGDNIEFLKDGVELEGTIIEVNDATRAKVSMEWGVVTADLATARFISHAFGHDESQDELYDEWLEQESRSLFESIYRELEDRYPGEFG